jgi:hypothetical protein
MTSTSRRTRPDRPIRLSRVAGEDGVSVEPLFDLPEHASFQLEAGPTASTDCASAAGYSIYRRIALPVAGRRAAGEVVCDRRGRSG